MAEDQQGFLRDAPPVGQTLGAIVVSGGSGGPVALDAAPLAALESINAAVTGTVALDAPTLAALESITALVSGTVALDAPSLAALETIQVGNLPVTQAVSAAALPLPVGAAIEATQAKRYGGGKLTKTAQVTASGNTTILTPAAGKFVRLYWVGAINDPDQSVSPRIRVGFDGAADYLYSGYAVAHWEVFDGAVNQAVVVNLDQAGDVAATVHYQEL